MRGVMVEKGELVSERGYGRELINERGYGGERWVSQWERLWWRR